MSVLVEYDLSASGSLKKKLPLPALAHPLKTKGLMHKKIVVIDHALVLLGSANLTASSLRHHANLVLGLHHPGLAAFLENPPSPTFTFYSHEQKGEIFLLPSSNEAGLARLIEAIALAKKRIRIAMFTLTHPTLATALILAKQRGVHVTVAVDYYTAKGASKKTLAALQEQGVEVILSQGRELLHHKWALIDKETLVMGSANWTKAAFSKNADFLLFFSPLKKEQTVFLDKLWDIIESESVSN